MLIRRFPDPELAPFVERLWHSDETGESAAGRARGERVLPTGCASLVFRLSDAPIRVFADADDRRGCTLGPAIVGGARAMSYVRETSGPCRSVGVHFRPGGAMALLGVPGVDLANRHTSLEDLWGTEARSVRDRLLEATSPESRLDLIERLLVGRTRAARREHPAVAHAIARLNESTESSAEASIRSLCLEVGLSHGRLIELFRRAVGLTPRVFARVRRFQRAIERAARRGCGGWAGVAAASGFCDQSHLIREFRALGGLAPGQYVPIDPDRPNHVSLR